MLAETNALKILAFAQKTCGRDLSLYKRILFISLANKDAGNAAVALTTLRHIMPQGKEELQILSALVEASDDIA